MKIEYIQLQKKRIVKDDVTPEMQQIIYDYLVGKATARQCAVALGKPPNPGHVTTYIPAIVRYWIDNGTITFNTKDF